MIKVHYNSNFDGVAFEVKLSKFYPSFIEMKKALLIDGVFIGEDGNLIALNVFGEEVKNIIDLEKAFD